MQQVFTVVLEIPLNWAILAEIGPATPKNVCRTETQTLLSVSVARRFAVCGVAGLEFCLWVSGLLSCVK